MTTRDLQPVRERLHFLLLAFAAIFVLAGMSALALTRESSAELWSSLAVWSGCLLAGSSLLKRFLPGHDPLLFALAIFLSGWGLVAIQRLAPAFAERQAIWLAISVTAMLGVAVLPQLLRWLRRYRYLVLAGALLLLGATIVFGRNPSGIAGAPRLWLSLGPLYIQPSEILKLILVAFVASYLAEQSAIIGADGGDAGRLPPFLPRLAGPMLLMWLLSLVILVWQRDLGTAMLFFIVFLLLLALTSGDWRILFVGALLVIIAAAAAYHLFDVVRLRVDIWLNPWPEADGRAYQIVQSLLAFGAGGVFGAGPGQGSPGYIPVAHSDFVFAALAEEWGLLGVVAVLSCFAAFVFRGLSIGLNQALRAFDRLLAIGLTMMLAVQALMIMAGVLKLMPLTGVTLPFVSYGGSSLLVCFIMAGLLLRLSALANSARQTGAAPAPSSRGIHHLLLGALAGLLLIGLAAAYWAIAGEGSLLLRDDNPRRIEALAAIQRGSILDRKGRLLAETVADAGGLKRRYRRPSTYSALGYYSLRYGTSAAEAAYDAQLAGAKQFQSLQDLVDRGLLGLPQVGADIRLTLDADLQDVLATAIGDARGAAVVLRAATGEVLTLISQPSFDPNRLDDDWEELVKAEGQPFFNRALQGNYQLGGAMYTVLLARALETDFDLQSAFADADAEIEFADGMKLACALPPERSALTLPEAYAHGCPAAFRAYILAQPRFDLDALLSRFAFDNPIRLDGFPQPEAIDLPADSSDELDEADVEMRAALGQGDLTATPLRLAALMAAIATDGSAPKPIIHAATRPADAEQWSATSVEAAARTIMSAETAVALRAILRQAWANMQGDSGATPYDVGAQIATSQSGESGQIWLNGFAANADRAPLAFVILLEDSEDLSRLLAIGQTLVEALSRRS